MWIALTLVEDTLPRRAGLSGWSVPPVLRVLRQSFSHLYFIRYHHEKIVILTGRVSPAVKRPLCQLYAIPSIPSQLSSTAAVSRPTVISRASLDSDVIGSGVAMVPELVRTYLLSSRSQVWSWGRAVVLGAGRF